MRRQDLYDVDPKDAGGWASPVFMVDKVGDVLGRLLCDDQGPNIETEDHPGIPPDVDAVSRNAVGKHVHSLMDQVWGLSQIELTESLQSALQKV